MKITIIIPFYKEQQYIADCINSVKIQTYNDWGAILVDDRGDDDTRSIVENLINDDDRFTLLTHQHNQGISAARNTALKIASGEYIYFLDADDKIYCPTTIEQMVYATQNKPQIIQGGCKNSDNTTARYLQGEYTSHDEIVKDFFKLNFVNVWSKFISRKFIEDNNFYFHEGIIYEDAIWSMEAYSKCNHLVALDEIVYYHNVRQGSIMQSSFTIHKVESLLKLVEIQNTLPQDDNIQHKTFISAMFLLKNLLLSKEFSSSYKKKVYKKLKLSKALTYTKYRTKLTPFSRQLAKIANSYLISRILCYLYIIYKPNINE